jgi:outer membrane immunogenic protein
MKRFLIAGAIAFAAAGQALAADLPPPVAPPPRAPATYVPVVPVFSWTGIYIGLNGGYNFGTVSPTAGTGFNTDGFLVGGTIGGNYQFGSFVIGIEGDGDYNSLSTTPPGAAPGTTFSSDWLATVRGRAGYAIDRLLIFGTGGAAFAPASLTGAGTTTMTGWTAGGGIEYAFTPNWTAKVEYLYVDFGSQTLGGGTFSQTDNVIRGGVNFKFW